MLYKIDVGIEFIKQTLLVDFTNINQIHNLLTAYFVQSSGKFCCTDATDALQIMGITP